MTTETQEVGGADHHSNYITHCVRRAVEFLFGDVVTDRLTVLLYVICPPSFLVPSAAYIVGRTLAQGYNLGSVDWGGTALGAAALAFFFMPVPILDAYFDRESDLKSDDPSRNLLARLASRPELAILYWVSLAIGLSLAASGAPRAVLVGFPAYALLAFVYSQPRIRVSGIGFVREGLLAALLVVVPTSLGVVGGPASSSTVATTIVGLWLIVFGAVLARDLVSPDGEKYPISALSLLAKLLGCGNDERCAKLSEESKAWRQKRGRRLAKAVLALAGVGLYAGGAAILLREALANAARSATTMWIFLGVGLVLLFLVVAVFRRLRTRYWYRAGVSAAQLVVLVGIIVSMAGIRA